MNFKLWFIITESKEEKALALELAGNQDNYNELLKVIPQNQKDSDPLLLLASYYLSQSKNINQTKRDIQNYIALLKNNKMPPIKVNFQTKKPDAPFDSYLYWTQIMHGHQGEEQAKQAKKYIPSDIDFQNEKPIATSPDGLIKVYQANNPSQCIILGKGQKFCISQPGNTMWKTYRDDKYSSFYFVYDHSRNDDLSIVVVDANKEGIELTDKVNKTGTAQNPNNPNQRDKNPDIYMRYLKSKGIDTNIFKNLPKTKEEIEEDKKLGKENEDLKWFISLSPQEKSSYIGRGHRLSNEQFDYIWDNKFYSLLEQYVKTGALLNDYQIDKITTDKDLTKNYIHNRIIAHHSENQESSPLNRKEYTLLNPQQQEKLYEDLPENRKLDRAISFGDFNLVKHLVEKGVEIPQSGVDAAAYYNDLNMLKYLVDKGATISDDTLENAASNGYSDIVKYLAEKGAAFGVAVSNAALRGNMDMVQYLIKKGAKVPDDIVGSAVSSDNLNLVKYFIDHGFKIPDRAITSAIAKSDDNILQYLLSKGAKIDNQAVGMAILYKKLKLANYFIDQGATIDNNAVNYAINIAEKDNDFSLIQYLLEKEAPITKQLIDYAIKNNKLNIIKDFIEKGSKINKDAAKSAIYANDINLLQFLIEKGADLPEYELDYAVAHGYFDMVKYLVEKGAKIPLYVIGTARNNERNDIADYLRNKLSTNK